MWDQIKTFFHLSTLRKFTEPKIQDNDNNNNNPLKPQARWANWGWPHSTAQLLGSLCLQHSHHLWHFSRGDRTVYRKPFVTGALPLLPPSSGRVPFPPHLSSEAYLAPGLAVQKAHPGWNLKPRDSQTPWLGQTVPPPILELNFREFWFYLYRG